MHKARLVDEKAQKGKRLLRGKNWSSEKTAPCAACGGPVF
jgi:hypothetical protein